MGSVHWLNVTKLLFLDHLKVRLLVEVVSAVKRVFLDFSQQARLRVVAGVHSHLPPVPALTECNQHPISAIQFGFGFEPFDAHQPATGVSEFAVFEVVYAGAASTACAPEG